MHSPGKFPIKKVPHKLSSRYSCWDAAHSFWQQRTLFQLNPQFSPCEHVLSKCCFYCSPQDVVFARLKWKAATICFSFKLLKRRSVDGCHFGIRFQDLGCAFNCLFSSTFDNHPQPHSSRFLKTEEQFWSSWTLFNVLSVNKVSCWMSREQKHLCRLPQRPWLIRWGDAGTSDKWKCSVIMFVSPRLQTGCLCSRRYLI